MTRDSLREMESYNRGYGMIRITNEMLHSLLGLPKEVVIDNIAYDPFRRITALNISSQGVVDNYTNHTGESQSVIEVSHNMWSESVIERMREVVQRWDDSRQSESDREQSREAMSVLYNQLRRERDGNDNTGH